MGAEVVPLRPFSLFDLHRENLFPLEVSGSRLGRVNLCHWAGQDVLVEEQEVGIFASLDAAALVLDEHLLGAVDG